MQRCDHWFWTQMSSSMIIPELYEPDHHHNSVESVLVTFRLICSEVTFKSFFIQISFRLALNLISLQINWPEQPLIGLICDAISHRSVLVSVSASPSWSNSTTFTSGGILAHAWVGGSLLPAPMSQLRGLRLPHQYRH